MASPNAQHPAIVAGDPQAQLKFEVLAGVHRGAALTIDHVADYRLGSSPQADIVLRDAGVAAEHAVLRIDGTSVRIDATGGAVGIAHGSIPLGHGARVRLPFEFTLGEAQLRLSKPGANPAVDNAWLLLSQARRSLADKPIAIASAAICLAVVATAVALGRPRAMQINAAQEKTAAVNAPSPAASGKAAPSFAQAVAELAARLRSAKISTLNVNAVDGRLLVSGALIKQQLVQWDAIRQWFDETYGRSIVLSADITTDAGPAMPTLQLRAIWYGEHPYIITGRGERYYQGAVLSNGWTIQEIGEHRLLLAKEGKTAALNY